MVCKNRTEPWYYSLGPHISQAKNNDTGQSRGTRSEKIPKIEVVSDNYSVVANSPYQDLCIRECAQTKLVQVLRVAVDASQESGNVDGDAHVEQESHADAASEGRIDSSASHAAYLSD